MNKKIGTLPIILVLLLVVLTSSVFILDEREKAVVLRFGKIVRSDIDAGLNFKMPFIDRVLRMDARLQIFDSKPQRYLTSEKKALMVDSYVKWKIIDASKFYSSTSGDMERARAILISRIDNGLRNKFGELLLKEVISEKRDIVMDNITKEVSILSKTDLGLEVVDVKLKRIDLPSEVSESVYSRMVSERAREAKELRSRGQQEAEVIRAEADRQRIVIEAEAKSYSEKTRGKGDAKAASIYSKAYSKDPAFYAFYRKLKTYENSFKNKKDVLVITPNGDLFKTLK